jgi:hypothetical protein
MVPDGRAAIVPSGVHGNGPGPFLICPCTEVAAPESRYAMSLSMSAAMP